MSRFTAAVVQMRSTAQPHVNIAAMDDLVRAAAAQGAHYVQTPEMTGIVQQSRKEFFSTLKDQAEDPVVAHAANLAAELGIHLHIGSTPIAAGDGRAANRAFVFGPDGTLLTRYDKIHMFDVDLDNGETWRESAVYQPGNETCILEALGAKFGIAICYDVRFPHLHDAYARAGVNVLTGPSCFTRQTGQAHWHVLLRSRAIETGSFMIAAAQGGDHEDGRATFGHSIIVDPWGVVLAEVAGEEPGLALAEIDTTLSQTARAKVPNLSNRRDFNPPKAKQTT
ncbi:carbon-nitrogen hydrolase family protein [Pseudahrensia aquimaris]|uniref:Carbon-nitrogen hydrolase family protein n=1 Tax=Pseudahrensia aquimaris TaxID=744461 RepID=A0ABW3FB26_9HYPH